MKNNVEHHVKPELGIANPPLPKQAHLATVGNVWKRQCRAFPLFACAKFFHLEFHQWLDTEVFAR